jgi:hypothetical protein
MRTRWVLKVLGTALFAASCGGKSSQVGRSDTNGGGTETRGGSGGMGGRPATGGSAGVGARAGTSGSAGDFACTGTTSCDLLDDDQCFDAVNDECHMERCNGTALPCESTINCRSQGCRRDANGECTGTPLPCGNFAQTTYCAPQEGCTPASGPCWGNQSMSCDFFPRMRRSVEECTAHPGCTFHPAESDDWTCTGTPRPCSENFTSMCNEVVGCAIPPSTAPCTGEPRSCSAIGVEGTCNALVGCTWDGQACVGTPAPCASFDDDQVGCFRQSGCNYGSDLPCSGTPAACETLVAKNGFGPDDCRRQYNCKVE